MMGRSKTFGPTFQITIRTTAKTSTPRVVAIQREIGRDAHSDLFIFHPSYRPRALTSLRTASFQSSSPNGRPWARLPRAAANYPAEVLGLAVQWKY